MSMQIGVPPIEQKSMDIFSVVSVVTGIFHFSLLDPDGGKLVVDY